MPAAPERGQAGFARSLLDPKAAIPPGFALPDGRPAHRRFAVYRNNVVVGLTDALAVRFPVCRRLVGEEFFMAMARLHVLDSPPRSPIMAEYGGDFADFVAAFPPAAGVPYLADIARLEHAIGAAYHAADAEPLTTAALSRLPQESWGSLVFRLHPSMRLVSSPHAIVSIWTTNTHDSEVRGIDAATPEDALVVRPRGEVAVTPLAPGGLAFLTALSDRAPLAAAAETAAAASPAFDLTASLVTLFTAGLVAAADHP